MAAIVSSWQAARSRALLGKNAAESALYGQAPGRSAKADRGVPSRTLPLLPIETPDCRTGEPRPPAHRCPVVLARRFHRARGQGYPHFGLGLVQEAFCGRIVRRKTS